MTLHSGTIFHDAATVNIFVENQVSLGAGKNVMAKAKFEQWLWDLACVEVKQYHSNNGVFIVNEFKGTVIFRSECTASGCHG